MEKSVAGIICAAGQATRFGGSKRKPFADVGGRAMFLRSMEILSGRSDVKQLLLAILPQDEEWVQIKWGANLKFFNVQLCFGGEHRYETVQKALEVIRPGIDLVAVHDAARCCVTPELIDKTIAAAAKHGAAIPANPVVGTLKLVNAGQIVRTVDRAGLYEAQTPQVFETGLLRQAYQNLKNLDASQISDDAQLVEALGRKVAIVESDPSNLKITYPSDIPLAEAILKSRPSPKVEGPIGPYIEAQW
jgi:2-C-methyl-D-erythritol 4-phosphate cytidylyltransferase